MINVLKALFDGKLLRIYIEISLYTLLMIYMLYKINFWEFLYTKDTLIWIFFSAVALSFEVVLNPKDKKIFLNIIKTSFTVVVFIEFILNMYTFSLIIEIIFMIFIFLLVLLLAFTDPSRENEKNDPILNKFFTIVSTIIGILITFYSIFKALTDSNILLTTNNVKLFLLPIVLTIMFIPYLFCLSVRATYEELFILLKLNKSSNIFINTYFKIRIYAVCRFNRTRILTLKQQKKHLIINMKTKQDVNKIFKKP